MRWRKPKHAGHGRAGDVKKPPQPRTQTLWESCLRCHGVRPPVAGLGAGLGAVGLGAGRPLTGTHTMPPPRPVEVAQDSPGVEQEASALVFSAAQRNDPSLVRMRWVSREEESTANEPNDSGHSREAFAVVEKRSLDEPVVVPQLITCTTDEVCRHRVTQQISAERKLVAQNGKSRLVPPARKEDVGK